MNNSLIDLLAGLSFYVVPYLTGRIFVKKTVPAWVLGALIWFILYFVLFMAGSILHFDFQSAVKASAAVITLASLFNIGRQLTKERPTIHRRDVLIALALSLCTALVYFLIWKRNTPYPLQLDWDI